MSTIYLPVNTGGYRQYVIHRPTNKWLQRQVQVRVSSARKLPSPLSDSNFGTRLHSTDFFPGGCGSGNLIADKFVERDGFKIWQFTDVFDNDDLTGKKALGISVEWPQPQGPSINDPLEIFAFPAPKDAPPEQWTDWMPASSQRQGDFGWWSEVHGQEPPAPIKIEYPFEIRWRLVLREDPASVEDDGLAD